MASIQVVERKSSMIAVCIIGLDTAYNQSTRLAAWFIDGLEDGDVYLENQISSGGYYQFTGLEPETEYTISCEIWYESSSGHFSSVELDPVTVSTLAGSAGYELIFVDLDLYGPLDVTNNPIFSTTEDSWIRKRELYCIKCSFSADCTIVFYSNSGSPNMDLIGYYTTSQRWNEITGEPYISSSGIDDLTDDDGQDYSDLATDRDFGASFDVEAGTTYYFWWKLLDDSPNGSYTVYVKKYNGGEAPSIKLWSWTSSNGSASDAQTVRAYEAITNHGPVSDFSYKVWNDLCNKISSVQSYAGIGKWATDDGNLPLPETLMTASDRTLTADRFNSMRYNLGRNYSTGIDPNLIQKGLPVKGEYFTKITTSLNNWIKKLSE